MVPELDVVVPVCGIGRVRLVYMVIYTQLAQSVVYMLLELVRRLWIHRIRSTSSKMSVDGVRYVALVLDFVVLQFVVFELVERELVVLELAEFELVKLVLMEQELVLDQLLEPVHWYLLHSTQQLLQS
jgi:hypothetical protein